MMYNITIGVLAACAIALGVIVVVVGLTALSGLIVWALWNALIPALFNGPSITYVQGVLVSVALTIVGSVFRRR